MEKDHFNSHEITDITDITIIGGGPTGLFAAFYAGMRKASVKVIESMPQLGGQLAALYPEKYIYDVAGFPKITAQGLVDNLVQQCTLFEPKYCLDEKVLRVHKREDNIFELHTTKQTHYTKSMIITAGCGAFEPRKLELEGCHKYEGINLHYFVTNQNQFKNQNVVIAGGGDSAIDWALMLEPIAKSITVVHRREKFRAHEHSVELMHNNPRIRILTPREIESLSGDTSIQKVVVTNPKEGTREELDADSLIISFGFVSTLGPIREWGLQIDKGSIEVNSKMETNIPGIYAAGDISTYPGKVKLIAVGFGEAPTAVNNAKQYIDPKSRLQPGHSSNLTF